jgi:hypothetical protein
VGAEVGVRRAVQGERAFTAKRGASSIVSLELRIITTRMIRRRELALKSGGPNVRDGRLGGAEAGLNFDEEEEEEPTVESLGLGNFTEDEYLQMASTEAANEA